MQSIFTRQAQERGPFRRIEYDGIQFGYSFRFGTQHTREIYLSCPENFRGSLNRSPVSPMK